MDTHGAARALVIDLEIIEFNDIRSVFEKSDVEVCISRRRGEMTKIVLECQLSTGCRTGGSDIEALPGLGRYVKVTPAREHRDINENIRRWQTCSLIGIRTITEAKNLSKIEINDLYILHDIASYSIGRHLNRTSLRIVQCDIERKDNTEDVVVDRSIVSTDPQWSIAGQLNGRYTAADTSGTVCTRV